MPVCRLCGLDKPDESYTLRKDSGKRRSECNPCRASSAALQRYGVEAADVESFRLAQGDCCAICGVASSDVPHKSFKHNPLVIDHNHETGEMRGLLCPTCNLLLGHAKDSPELLEKAALYLRVRT